MSQEPDHNKKVEPVRLLRDLLALIHRDGGQHTAAVGLYQSVQDARSKIHIEPAEEPVSEFVEEVRRWINKDDSLCKSILERYALRLCDRLEAETKANEILAEAKKAISDENEELRTDYREMKAKLEAAEAEIKTFADWRERLRKQALADNATVKYDRKKREEAEEKYEVETQRADEAEAEINAYKKCTKDHKEICPDTRCWLQVLRDKQMDEIEQLQAKLKAINKRDCETERYPIGSMSAMRKEISQLEAKFDVDDKIISNYYGEIKQLEAKLKAAETEIERQKPYMHCLSSCATSRQDNVYGKTKCNCGCEQVLKAKGHGKKS